MTARKIKAMTLVAVFAVLLPETEAFSFIEPQTTVDLIQDFLSGDLRSHGKAWLLDTDTGEPVETGSLGGDHTIEGAGGGGPILTRVSFSNRNQYEAIIFSSSYVFGDCYEGTIQAFHATTINPTRQRSSQVCPQLAPSSSTEDPDLNPEPSCECDPELGCSCTPILIDVNGNGFQLSGPGDPVAFDIDAVGTTYNISWTARSSDDSFLALDRNGNGVIDDGSELFGSATPQPTTVDPNGFLALALYDSLSHGGNADGLVSAEDAIFESLLLWRDVDHDGASQLWELTPLRDSHIQAISLDYHLSRRKTNTATGFAGPAPWS